MSSIVSVAAPTQPSSVGPQRCQGSAAACHWSVVVRLYAPGSNGVVLMSTSERKGGLVTDVATVREVALGRSAASAADILPAVALISESTVEARERAKRVADGVYGTILVLAVVAALSKDDHATAGAIAAGALTTSVVFWLAHIYADVLS